jgi:hypothetical protein
MNTFIGCLADETGNAQTPFKKLKQRRPKYASRIASPAGEALEKAARPIFTSNYFRTPGQQETRQTTAVRIQFAWVHLPPFLMGEMLAIKVITNRN